MASIEGPGLRGGGLGQGGSGFTLIELLVSVVVLALIMVLVFQTVSNSSSIWTRSTGKMHTFQAARDGFEALTRNLTQATLQSYYGYADAQGNPVPLINPSFKLSSGSLDRSKVPARYLRASELHFLCGPAAEIFTAAGVSGVESSGSALFFQAPLGVSGTSAYQARSSLLNTCGYFVQFGGNDNSAAGTGAIPTLNPPPVATPTTTYRYRLMEVVQPAEQTGIYEDTNRVDAASGLPVYSYSLNWLKNLLPGTRANRHVLADNVLLLILLPKLSPEEEKLRGGVGDGSLIAPRYTYDSRSWLPDYSGSGLKRSDNASVLESLVMNRLAPIVHVLMVAVDDRSAQRLSQQFSGANPAIPPLADSTLQGKLGLTTGFRNAADFRADVTTLRNGLDQLGLNYRIFETEVRLPNASYGE